MRMRILGFFLLLISASILLFILYFNSQKRNTPLVFTPKLMLAGLWNDYKVNYWEAQTGRTLDKQRGNITTSEGQSYTMLRAVWMDDKPTFDKTWEWTRVNLQRPDSLFSWLYGQRGTGDWGILADQGGTNTASDADTDIALALIFAARRWNNPAYAEEAKKIITQIWEQEVVSLRGKPYLAANNLEKNSPDFILINPSYFAPYAYREFAQVDTEHNWNAVVDSSFELIMRAGSEKLGQQSSSGLVPDWVRINKITGELSAPDNGTLTTNFSYDALRLPLRLALDVFWNNDPRARQVLGSFGKLEELWQADRRLPVNLAHDGNILDSNEAPAMYGGALGYFMVHNPTLAQAIYNEKLVTLYNPDTKSWMQPLGYYDDNITWFGLALYNNLLFAINPDGSVRSGQTFISN